MVQEIFKNLRRELKEDYNLVFDRSKFRPFEDWRDKLQDYSSRLGKTYEDNLVSLRKGLGLD